MTKYFDCLKRGETATFTIVVLPHAGGTAEIFNDWIKYLPQNFELYALALPGRGKKTLTEVITNFDYLIKELTNDIIQLLNKPFVFLGHSMGALIGYELVKSIMLNYNKSPAHFYVSSYPAPHLPNYNILQGDVTDDELVERLIERNGTSNEFLTNKRFLRLILPILRADYQLLNSYNHKGPFTLKCPITSILGTKDNITDIQMADWSKYTNSSFQLFMLEGDHFYLKEQKNIEKICQFISQNLESVFLEGAN